MLKLKSWCDIQSQSQLSCCVLFKMYCRRWWLNVHCGLHHFDLAQNASWRCILYIKLYLCALKGNISYCNTFNWQYNWSVTECFWIGVKSSLLYHLWYIHPVLWYVLKQIVLKSYHGTSNTTTDHRCKNYWYYCDTWWHTGDILWWHMMLKAVTEELALWSVSFWPCSNASLQCCISW